jgi:CheY-like chemotaxis protein
MRELRTALVVEDNRISRMMLREILLIHGVKVLEAADGVEAIEIIEQGPPDLVISDILMPRCDGFKLAAHIKSAGYSPPMVLFLVTAVYKSQVWKREALTDHHVHEFITKPIDPDEFIGIIRRYFTMPAQPPPFSLPAEDAAEQSPEKTPGAAVSPAKVQAKAHPNRVSADRDVDDLVSQALKGLVVDKKTKT